VEFRCVLPKPAPSPAPYEIEVLVDGVRHDWFRLQAVRSTKADLGGQPVGARDEVELALPAGTHDVATVLRSSAAETVLMRYRIWETGE
jgi:hypothetical protein